MFRKRSLSNILSVFNRVHAELRVFIAATNQEVAINRSEIRQLQDETISLEAEVEEANEKLEIISEFTTEK